MREEWDGSRGTIAGDVGMDDSVATLQLDEARWSAVVATLPPLVRARARNGVRTRALVYCSHPLKMFFSQWRRTRRSRTTASR